MASKHDIDEVVNRPYLVEIEYGETPDEGVLAYVAEWPDCFAAGRTREEAVAALERAMRELAAYRIDEGLEIPEPIGGYGGKVLVRMPRTLHRDADMSAKREGVSLNQWLVSTVARALGPAAETYFAGSLGRATHSQILLRPAARGVGRKAAARPHRRR